MQQSVSDFFPRLVGRMRVSRLLPIVVPIARLLRRIGCGDSRIFWGTMRGMWFPDDDHGTLWGTYEWSIQRAMIAHLRQGNVFYDVGAYHGYFSLLGSRLVGASGSVLAFEPDPENARGFERVMELNRIENCTLIPAAVSNTSGALPLYLHNVNSFQSSLLGADGERSIAVRSVTLDEFVLHHPRPALIKLDVEGAEDLVLQGTQRLLSSEQPPVWIIELHSADKEEFVTDFLQRFGYSVEILPAARKQKHALALPPTR